MAARNVMFLRSLFPNRSLTHFMREQNGTFARTQTTSYVPQRPFTCGTNYGHWQGSGMRYHRSSSLHHNSLPRPRLHKVCYHHASLLRQNPQQQGWINSFVRELDKRHYSSHYLCASVLPSYNSRTISNHPLTCDVTIFSPLLRSGFMPDIQSRGFRSHHPRDTHDRNGGRRKASQENKGEEKEEVSTEPAKTDTPPTADADTPDPGQKLSLYQRFKKTYKEHGKVLVVVHVMTSAVWFGTFYTAARCGFDIVPLLESWNLSDKVIAPFRSGGLGDVALAYLMYKLATPARYTVTIGGTNLAIRYLRREGRLQPVPHEDKLRSLYKEGKEDIKRRSNARIRKFRRKRQIKKN